MDTLWDVQSAKLYVFELVYQSKDSIFMKYETQLVRRIGTIGNIIFDLLQ